MYLLSPQIGVAFLLDFQAKTPEVFNHLILL